MAVRRAPVPFPWMIYRVDCPRSMPLSRNLSTSLRTKKLLGVVALVYLLPVIAFLLGYFLSEGLAESTRYIIAIAAAAVAFLPSIFYDRYAKRHEILTYTVVRLF